MLPNWLYGKSLRKLQEILNSGGQTAAGVSYSNTESGLEATNAQAAIDEVVTDVNTKAAQSTVSTLSDTVTTLTETVNGKAALTQISNPNLLDNPWFTINQRGITTGFTNNAYFVDRWRKIWGDMTIDRDSTGLLTLTKGTNEQGSDFGQKIEQELINLLFGKTVTTSVLLSDGTIMSKTFDMPDEPPSSEGWYGIIKLSADENWECALTINSSLAQVIVNCRAQGSGTSISIRAIKFELGSISTLAMDTVPNYQQELAKCQRYFYRCIAPSLGFYFGLAIAWDSSKMSIIMPMAPMRSTPTVTLSALSDFLVSKGASTASPHNISNIEIYSYNGQNHITGLALTVTESDLTSGDIYVLKATVADAYIDFSADL